jgi:flagellar hook-associated protein 2
VDGDETGLNFSELQSARDAVLEIGSQGSGTGLLVSSAANTFDDVIPGIDLTVVAASTSAVKVDVTKAQSQITSAVEDFVEAFNSIRTNLDEVTKFDETTLTTGILFGTSAALRVESDLNRVLSGRFFGLGQFTSLESIGLSFASDGKLQLNQTKLEEANAEDSNAIERLFTDETSGITARLKSAIDRLAGEDDSLLETRADALATVIESNKDRIKFMDERLAMERERLLLTFAQLESTIAGMQQNLTALAGLQPIPPLVSTR